MSEAELKKIDKFLTKSLERVRALSKANTKKNYENSKPQNEYFLQPSASPHAQNNYPKPRPVATTKCSILTSTETKPSDSAYMSSSSHSSHTLNSSCDRPPEVPTSTTTLMMNQEAMLSYLTKQNQQLKLQIRALLSSKTTFNETELLIKKIQEQRLSIETYHKENLESKYETIQLKKRIMEFREQAYETTRKLEGLLTEHQKLSSKYLNAKSKFSELARCVAEIVKLADCGQSCENRLLVAAAKREVELVLGNGGLKRYISEKYLSLNTTRKKI